MTIKEGFVKTVRTRQIYKKEGFSKKQISGMPSVFLVILDYFLDRASKEKRLKVSFLNRIDKNLKLFFSNLKRKKSLKDIAHIIGYDCKTFLRVRIKSHEFKVYFDCSLYSHSRCGSNHYFPPASIIIMRDDDWERPFVVTCLNDIQSRSDRQNFKGYKYAGSFLKYFVTEGVLSSQDNDLVRNNGFKLIYCDSPDLKKEVTGYLKDFVDAAG